MTFAGMRFFESYRALKVVISCFAIVLVFFFKDHFTPVNIVNGYVIPFSSEQDDALTFFLNPERTNQKALIRIYDVSGKPVDSVKAALKVQDEINPDAFKSGFSFSPSYDYHPKGLETGLYFIENKVPFIIEDTTAELLILFPFLDLHCVTNTGGKSFIASESSDGIAAPKLSIDRPLDIDAHTIEFMKWVNVHLKGMKYSLVSDLQFSDIERKFPSAKAVFIFRDQKFWTNQMRSEFDRFIRAGGNALFASGAVMNNRIRLNKSLNQIEFYDLSANDVIEEEKAVAFNADSQSNFNFYSIGMDYAFAGRGEKSSLLTISKPDHPLFRGTGMNWNDTMHIGDCFYNGAPITRSNDSISIDLEKIRFYSGNILGLTRITSHRYGMIAELKKTKTSGKIVHLGCSNWTKPEVLNDTLISRILLNGIQYVMQ